MFNRKNKFKPYRMKPIRVKPWRENAWIEVMLFVGVLGSLIADLADLLTSLENSQAASEGIDFQQDDEVFESNSPLFSNDDDDVSRGLWDPSSEYYTMFHMDAHNCTDMFNHD